jgi:WD40 repeat protein
MCQVKRFSQLIKVTMLPLRGSGQVYLTGGFSPDGRTFAAGGLGHIVELWDLADPAALPRQIATDGTVVTFANYTPAGELVIARMRGALHLVPAGGDAATTWLSGYLVSRAALAADGTKLVTAGDNVVVWDVGTEFREVLEVAAGPGEFFTGVAVSPEGKRFASARVLIDGGSVVEVWDVIGGGYYRQFPINGTRADKLTWSPDGCVLAGLVDKHLTVWDAETWEEVFGPLPGVAQGSSLSIAFHPFSGQLLTGDTNGEVSCWDMNSWRVGTTFRWDVGPIYCLAFAPDGLRAAAAGHGAIILWDFDA